MSLKVFSAIHEGNGCRGYHDDRIYTITANSKSEALGLILEHQEDTKAESWEIEELDISKPSVNYLYSHSTY